jgi:predicted ribosomally synthesized peptide with SipW-like signal peptide
MKKIIASLAMIALVGTLAVGATRAWFTDSEQVLGNQVTTGDFEVGITPDSFTITGIGPAPAEESSYVSAGTFAVKNIGDYDMKWQGKLNVTQNDNSMSNYLKVRVNMLAHGWTFVGGEWVNCNYGPSVGVVPLFTGVPLNELKYYSYGHILMDDPTWAFEPNHNACYEIFARMDPTAPNSVQESELKADLLIEATQRANPGWTQ